MERINNANERKEVEKMAEKKITYSEALDVAIAIEGLDKEVVDKLVALKASIEKKSTNRKPSKNQVENEGLCVKVLAVLADMAEGAVASDIIKASDEFNGMSTPKMTALLKKLVEDGKATREEIGRKAIYKIATVAEDAETENPTE